LLEITQSCRLFDVSRPERLQPADRGPADAMLEQSPDPGGGGGGLGWPASCNGG
jgi:hypothetical protein